MTFVDTKGLSLKDSVAHHIEKANIDDNISAMVMLVVIVRAQRLE